MNIECFVFLINQVFDIVDMYHTIERRRNDVIQVWVVLDFCDPTFMNQLFNMFSSFLDSVKCHVLL